MKKNVRYSHAFRMQAIRDVESGQLCAAEVERKYNITGNGTVTRWVRLFGSGQYGKLIRVEKPDEINQATRLRSELRRAKEALADAHMELALERSFLEVACEQLDQTPEAFKKKQAGKRRTWRSRRTPGSK